ncbi:hypothetical protein [Devosia sp. Leaf64]|jgi:plasmid stabilization system protein ParE|uniref:type II toxin-antitoxin system RelE/ParE family toxin n=1 Tax=Devosia sp. Leaf64 TaxID=1736229 RepID=UPI0007139ED6|nr:hypothetical protein [Devosia sp. Leaf64]KQN74388.1 hypothetical protein ASE94_19940 [Devosia sp. Leaf64]
MRVKVSKEAKRDIQREIDYLKGKTISGILTFRSIIERARQLLASQPSAGRVRPSSLPIRGAQRIIVDGWCFDYDVIDGSVWLQRVTHSIATPSLKYDDDFDYEKDDPDS